MKTLKYGKWLLISLAIVIFMACGGSSSGGDSGDENPAQEPIVELSYPEYGDVLIRFTQTNGNAQGEYVLENEDGEHEFSGTVDGTKFSITFIDDFPNEIVMGNSNATFTYNGDDTYNYEIYIDGELLEEEYSVALTSLELSSVARSITRASEAECKVKRGDITFIFQMALGIASKLKEDFAKCLDNDINTNYQCGDKYPGAWRTLEEVFKMQINGVPEIAKLIEDYKKSCFGNDDDVIVEPTVQSISVSNSTSSTFRIVRLAVGFAGDASPAMMTIPIGEGIHRGYNVTFDVDSEECDRDWLINASYNDSPTTSCSTTALIKCGEVNSFEFNNLSCQ